MKIKAEIPGVSVSGGYFQLHIILLDDDEQTKRNKKEGTVKIDDLRPNDFSLVKGIKVCILDKRKKK